MKVIPGFEITQTINLDMINSRHSELGWRPGGIPHQPGASRNAAELPLSWTLPVKVCICGESASVHFMLIQSAQVPNMRGDSDLSFFACHTSHQPIVNRISRLLCLWLQLHFIVPLYTFRSLLSRVAAGSPRDNKRGCRLVPIA